MPSIFHFLLCTLVVSIFAGAVWQGKCSFLFALVLWFEPANVRRADSCWVPSSAPFSQVTCNCQTSRFVLGALVRAFSCKSPAILPQASVSRLQSTLCSTLGPHPLQSRSLCHQDVHLCSQCKQQPQGYFRRKNSRCRRLHLGGRRECGRETPRKLRVHCLSQVADLHCSFQGSICGAARGYA